MLWENKGRFCLLLVRQLWNTFACAHLAGHWPFSERSRATLAEKECLWRQKGWHSWTGNCFAVPKSTLDATQQNWLSNAYFSSDSQTVASLSTSLLPEPCNEQHHKQLNEKQHIMSIICWWLLFVLLCVQVRDGKQMFQNYIWQSTV